MKHPETQKYKDYAIIGAGGFAREVHASIQRNWGVNVPMFVDDKFLQEDKNYDIRLLSEFNPNHYKIVVAIGNPTNRYDMVQRLPKETEYFNFIDTRAIFLEEPRMGVGNIICAGVIITTNVSLGNHCHLNLLSTIGHDCEINSYFTTAPGAKISGNCKIFDRVYIGTNASIKEKLTIHSNITIGSNATVVKDIEEPGIYVGVPVKKIK